MMSYDLWDASVRWTNAGGDWTVIVSGRNMTDEEYLVTGVYGTAFQAFEGMFDRGRQWVLEVRKDFYLRLRRRRPRINTRCSFPQ